MRVRELYVHLVGTALIICLMGRIYVTSFTRFYDLQAPLYFHVPVTTFLQSRQTQLCRLYHNHNSCHLAVTGKYWVNRCTERRNSSSKSPSETSVRLLLQPRYMRLARRAELYQPCIFIQSSNPAPRPDHAAHSQLIPTIRTR
jgi:hypothetical protein